MSVAPSPSGSPPAELEAPIVAALQSVYDPEIPVDIHSLGLIYALEVDADGFVDVTMTLTSPACPVAGQMPAMVQSAVEAVPGVRAAQVHLTWDPPWTPERMSEACRLQLGLL